MRRTLLVGFIVALVSVARGSAADQQSIRALENRFVKAFLTNDWKALATFYTTDAVLLPPNAPPVSGNQHIADFFAASPIAITAFKLEGADTQIHDRFATHRGTYTITFTMSGSTTPITDVGKFLWVLRKSPQGTWRVAMDMFSSNNPPPK